MNESVRQTVVWTLAVLAACEPAKAEPPASGKPLEWAGRGSYRLWLSIEGEPSARKGDEAPAVAEIDFDAILRQVAPGRTIDLNAVQVIRQAASGPVASHSRFAFGSAEYDAPWRWYDDSIPHEFPEVERAVSTTSDKLQYTSIAGFGHYYDCLGSWRSGRLAFSHTRGPDEARYGVYFDLLPDGAVPREPPPRAFLGDGKHRCLPEGASSTGLIHSRAETADWNADGLVDLLVGCGRGGIIWFANRGTAREPSFPSSQLLFTTDGRPLDVGYCAAPCAADWDLDGRVDLLVGAEWNRILFYRNVGEPGGPGLEFAGPLCTDQGEVLTLPVTPVEDSPPDVFTRDYYPVPEAADWDADGDLDLLAGGYITGRIYFFENVAGPRETPRLRLSGPVEADGAPIDVSWCAAPDAADVDRDGDLDLVSGSMPRTAGGGDSASPDAFLIYFKNVGSRSAARFERQVLPHQGEFPIAALATPRFVDWSGDGLPDLVVSAGNDLYLMQNRGTPDQPQWDASRPPLASRWGSSPLAATQFADWNDDGLADAIDAPRVSLNLGKGNPGLFAPAFSVLKAGQVVSHLSGVGDDWQYQRLYDLDNDGRLDLMDADHQGRFWFHANRGSREVADFDPEGAVLRHDDGRVLQVGLDRKGFNALQGARATYTVGDCDRDEFPDLVAADTFGLVRWFRQLKPSGPESGPAFAEPVEVAKLATRAAVCLADWNGDGRIDLVAGTRPEDVVLLVNAGAREAGVSPFQPPVPLGLAPAPYGAGAPIVVVDYNHDGDADLLVHTAYGYSCWYERSFIESGYVPAVVNGIEQRGE
jgi:hypothetical protein